MNSFFYLVILLLSLLVVSSCEDRKEPKRSAFIINNITSHKPIQILSDLKDTTVFKSDEPTILDDYGYCKSLDTLIEGTGKRPNCPQNAEIWTLEHKYKNLENPTLAHRKSPDSHIWAKAIQQGDSLWIKVYYRGGGKKSPGYVFVCRQGNFISKYDTRSDGFSIRIDDVNLTLNHFPVKKGDVLIGRFKMEVVIRMLGNYKRSTNSCVDEEVSENELGWFKCVVE
jgi:hypothetical protein